MKNYCDVKNTRNCRQDTYINGYYDSFRTFKPGMTPSGWTGCGKWEITEGIPAGTWGVHRDYKMYYRAASSGDMAFYNAKYSDFDCICTMQMTGDRVSLVFRMTDADNYYFIRLDVPTGSVVFGKKINGDETVINKIEYKIESGVCYHLRIVCRGSNIICRILDDRVASFFRNMNPGDVIADINTDDNGAATPGYIGVYADAPDIQFNNVSIIDISKNYDISNDIFDVSVGGYGEIKLLKLQNEPYDTNFVTNESEHRYEVGKNQFFGELRLTYQPDGGEAVSVSTGDSYDIRKIERVSDSKITVAYESDSAARGGIQGNSGLAVTEAYILEADCLRFEFELENKSGRDMRIDDIGMPISWNNHWQFEDPYENYLAATDNFISYNASYMVLERARGGGNKIVFLPDSETDTAVEYRKFKTTSTTWANPPEEYYIKSNAVKAGGQGYLESSYLTLNAGETKKYSFKIYKIGDDMKDKKELLYSAGSLDITVNPGMIFPFNMTAKIDIHTKYKINSVTASDPDAVITPVSACDGHNMFTMSCKKLGRVDVTVCYGDGKRGVMQFWIQEPLDDAITRHVNFLIDNCRITDPTDHHYLGFLEWDNAKNVAKKGGNGCNNNDYEQMYDGPAFIAEKEVYAPVQSEITIVDDYLIDLVWAKEVIHGGEDDGYLCHACCEGRCWNEPNPPVPPYKCTRSYNYPRVYNTFFSMYKAAKYYPGMKFRWPAKEYIKAAALILKRSLELCPYIGLMGELTTADIIGAAAAEIGPDTADELYKLALKKCESMNEEKYPFASEFGTDSTGEEGAYHFSKLGKRPEAMKVTIDKSVAWTGKVPVWYWQTTSNRQDMEWWLFQYTVGLHGHIFNDYYMNVIGCGRDVWSFVYPFKLSPFVHINSGQPELIGKIGTNWGNYHAEYVYNWNHGFPYSESAESDVSLWAGLQLLSSDVVEADPVFGLTGYGCEVSECDGGNSYNITPMDGLYRRLNIVDKKSEIFFTADSYSNAVVKRDLSQFVFTVTNTQNNEHEGEIHITGLMPGIYSVSVDGNPQGEVKIASCDKAVFRYRSVNEKTFTLKITMM